MHELFEFSVRLLSGSSGSSFGLPAAALHWPATQALGFSIREVELAASLAKIRERDPHFRTLSIGDRFARHIRHSNELRSHCEPSSSMTSATYTFAKSD